jgi:hypothetical protein
MNQSMTKHRLISAQPAHDACTRVNSASRGSRIRALLQGYTFEAIREALADAGVAVSNTTVQREAARAVNRPGPVSRMPIPAAVAKDGPGRLATVAVPSATETSVPPPRDRLSGRAVAEAFFSTQITNPLIREKEQR